MRGLIFWLLVGSAVAQVPGSTPTFRVSRGEVSLDLVVTDARQRMTRNLKPEEVQILDNGIAQPILSFRKVSGEQSDRRGPAGPEAAPGTHQGTTLPVYNLVAIVFDRLSSRARLEAAATAEEFVKTQLEPRDYAGIYLLDLDFRELASFTLDRSKSLAAIRQVAKAAMPNYLDHQAHPGTRTDASGHENEAANALGTIASDMEDMTGRLETETSSRLTVQPLLNMVEAMSHHPGRKAILFFSERLALVSNTMAAYHRMLVDANRAGVSFYVLDPGGLDPEPELSSVRAEMARAVAKSTELQTNPLAEGKYPHLGEDIEASGRADRLGILADLAESTGGMLIANTNDLRGQLLRVGADIHTHYEVTYPASGGSEDGRYHAIQVVLKRPHLVARTRPGYYALPMALRPTQEFEAPLLDLLGQTPRPDALPINQASFEYPEARGDPTTVLSLEMPLAGLQNQSKRVGTVQEHLSAMVLVADWSGNVIRKFSHDFPIEGDSSLTRRALLFERQTTLPPGLYHVTTLVREPETGRATARTSALVVPATPAGTLRLSSVAVITRTDSLGTAGLTDAQSAATALDVNGVRIVPNVGEPLHRDGMRALGLYYVVYPSRQPASGVRVVFRRNGEPVAQAEEALNAPLAGGRVPMLLSFPMAAFRPGAYEVEVRVGAAVQRTAFVLQ